MLKTLCYDNIDSLPAFNYFRVTEYNEPKYLIKRKGIIKADLKRAYEAIQTQIVNEFGINDKYLQIINLRAQIASLEIDMYIRGDRSAETFINILSQELKELVEQPIASSDEVKVSVEKYLGFKINMKEISIKEYFNYIKQISKDNGK